MPTSLEIQNLSHFYSAGKSVLNDINLTLRSGLMGLLGSNGAGKSTLMRILAGISQPSEGTILWNNHDVAKSATALRETLGYLPQSFGVYDNLTAVEFLTYLASLKQISPKVANQRIDQLLETLNLNEVANRRLNGFSGGMKQRVGIAQALLNDPKLLILDEPSTGLDPEERASLRDLLSDMAADRIIILSTHIVSDVESIASHIALLDKGNLLEFCAPEVLLKRLENSVWQCKVNTEQMSEYRQRYCISNSIRQMDGFQLRIVSHDKPSATAVKAVPCLEDAYLFFTNRGANSAIISEEVA